MRLRWLAWQAIDFPRVSAVSTPTALAITSGKTLASVAKKAALVRSLELTIALQPESRLLDCKALTIAPLLGVWNPETVLSRVSLLTYQSSPLFMQ